MSLNGDRPPSRLSGIIAVVAAWFALTALTRYIPGVPALRAIHPILPAALRMTLMLLVTWLYIGLREHASFGLGFGFSFAKIGRDVFWGVVIALVAAGAVEGYQALIVKPLTRHAVEASGVREAAEAIRPFGARLIEYLYIVYEGIVEVLVFVGFLLDRLARTWKPVWAVPASNAVFALWHYAYWRQGALEGSLMIGLTFVAGAVISLGYLRTKNSLTPVISHVLVDTPGAIRVLLGLP
jgi:membrane protease YdiL (CAAX protease family)